MFIAILVLNQYTSNLVDFNNGIIICFQKCSHATKNDTGNIEVTLPITFVRKSCIVAISTRNDNKDMGCVCEIHQPNTSTFHYRCVYGGSPQFGSTGINYIAIGT